MASDLCSGEWYEWAVGSTADDTKDGVGCCVTCGRWTRIRKDMKLRRHPPVVRPADRILSALVEAAEELL